MKRWKNKLAGALLAFGGLCGCKQQLYMTLEDQRAVTLPGIPKDLNTNPELLNPSDGQAHPRPMTVDNPERKQRYITLSEAFAIALESGMRGLAPSVINTLSPFNTVNGGGRVPFAFVDDLISFQTRAISGDDAIRAFALDPAIVGADIEGVLAKFDTRWITSSTWNKVDTATSNVLNNFSNGDTMQFASSLYKPLPTGGTAGITWNTNYTKLSNPPQGFAVINPAWQPSATISLEQPLLQSYGIEMNQLLPSHPGSVFINGLKPSGGRTEGILVTRIRSAQARQDFERSVNIMLFNVENVYWFVYANYFALYSAEQGLRQAYLTLQLRQSEFLAGKSTAHEVAQVHAQFASFRTQRIVALQQVIESERQFRGILGLPVEDGTRIVPADAPTLTPYQPDWTSSFNEALVTRPELVTARMDVKANQLNLMVQQNGMRPDIRFFGNYGVNSIGTRLDGSSPQNALNNLGQNHFNNWTTGLRADIPLGTRDAHAAARAASLNVARSFVVLKNQELKAERFLAGSYQNVFSAYRQIETAREQRMALAEQLRGLYARIQAGRDSLITILTAQQNFASALSSEHNAIANYNIAIAAFQYAKGTIMDYDNVTIADGPLPTCVLARAAEHQRKRTEGLILRERQTPPSGDGPHPLPALIESQPNEPGWENAPLPRAWDPIPQDQHPAATTGTNPKPDPTLPTAPISQPDPVTIPLPPTSRPESLPVSKSSGLN